MNKVFFFLSIVIFASCGQPEQKSSEAKLLDAGKQALKADDTLQSIINANVNSQPIIDSIFLGFTFSMTKAQAMAHFNWMIKDKKLLMITKDQRYEYPMAFQVVKANASIAPEFQDDKLYKLSLVIEPVDDVTTNDMVFSDATITYLKKYSDYHLFTEADIIDAKEKKYHWIKNNLHIFLHKNPDATIVEYINLPAQQMIDKQKSKEIDSTKSATNKDI